MIESRLDRLISYLSPERGAKRAQARKMIEALSYEGARVGRRESGWVTGSTSANSEISGDRITLRNRVRSLLRDNAYAVKGRETLVANRIGTGILASADGPNKRLNEKIQAQWKTWVDRCDYMGKTDLYGIQALAERCRIESGEALIRLIAGDEEVPLRLQVLEPDYLDTTKNEKPEGGREILEGIEYANGRVVAYWIYPTHPGENNPLIPFSIKSQRVPANQILHYYRPTRPGQLSGVSEFAPVIRRLYDLDGYADAELMAKKISACSVGAVTTPGGPPASALAPTGTDASGRRTESFAPGMYHYLKPGENITFFNPRQSDGYAEFNEVELHAVSAGLRMPYPLLTGDYSNSNYTQFRADLVQFKAAVESDQWQLVIPQICLPVWDRFVLMAEGTRVQAKFTPPRFGLLDPASETEANLLALQAGIESYPNLLRREGYEWKEKLAEISEFNTEVDRLGIVLSSDPRQEQKVKEAAAKPAPAPAEEAEPAAA